MPADAASFRGGDGPPLVLLHSGFSTWVEWRSSIPALTAEREVMAPTLPGSEGGAPLELSGTNMLGALADHVEERIEEAGWSGPVALAGSSFGGVVALELAARGRAAAVVALAPPWVAGRGLAYYMALFPAPMASLRLTQPLHGLIAGREGLRNLIFLGSRQTARIDAADASAMWRSIGRFPIARVGLASGRRGPGLPEMSKVACPVTFVWGTRDLAVPRWMWRRWQEALPDANVETLVGFPHIPQLRDPGRIARLILDATAVPAE